MLAATVAAVADSACTSTSSSLPYRPEVQPPGATISAAYTIVADRLRVEIESGGRRLERAQIVQPDGSLLEAQTIEYTPASGGGGSPVGLGFGIGGFSGGGGSAVGTGVGVSTGGIVGGGGSGAIGSSIASFPLAQAGPSPWRVRVTLQGTEPAEVLVGGPPPPPR
jgi:hypothetical protein